MLHAMIDLPAPLSALDALARDLRWTWNHAGDAMWAMVDAELWRRTQSPWTVLENLSPERAATLAADAGFLATLAEVVAEHQQYLESPGAFARRADAEHLKGIAFFSMEFGLSESLPIYAGGLGILAGDYLKAASDLGVPAVGIGLLYAQGYLRQSIDREHRQRETYPYNDPASLPVQRTHGIDGAPLTLRLPLPGRTLHVRVWEARVGRVRLYLLDSNDPANSDTDRGITSRLYGDGAETRLLQQLVLGICGWSLVETLGLPIDFCHINEGHAAFAVLERARRFMRRNGTAFIDALWATRPANLFTTHTSVSAAFDAFDPSLLRQYSILVEQQFGESVETLLALGQRHAGDPDARFEPACLALRGCGSVNGVSRLHGRVSRRLFAELYPRWPIDEVPVGHVTNGVHVPTWDSRWADEMWTRTCGKERWCAGIEALPDAVAAVDDASLWSLAAQRRSELVERVRTRLAAQLTQRGATPEQIDAAALVLDANVLTIGFARRFTGYKRPDLLLGDGERLRRLLLDPQRPVQLLLAGLAHPNDLEAKDMIRRWVDFANEPAVRGHVVFLENYDIGLAQDLVQGVDLWLNTPVRGREACGTSGMKVLANGGLNLSTLDGWWDEAYAEDVGWVIGDSVETRDDAGDAAQLYAVLEEDVVPAFYTRDASGLPRDWVRRMRHSMSQLTPRYSSNRMLLEYVEDYYRPGADLARRRGADGAGAAHALRVWHEQLARLWPQIHFGAPQALGDGAARRMRVAVYLGDVPAGDVRVELYADADGAHAPEHIVMSRGEAVVGAHNGYFYEAALPGPRPAAHYTPRAVAQHGQDLLPSEVGLIAWQR